jgi:simple sugar transport system permease protein
MAADIHLPYQYFLLLPYLVTIVLLVAISRNASYPAALLKPYRRDKKITADMAD